MCRWKLPDTVTAIWYCEEFKVEFIGRSPLRSPAFLGFAGLLMFCLTDEIRFLFANFLDST